jgi:uncharacterized protein
MLGRLAPWLSFLGFDVLYYSKIDEDDLLAAAGRENRILLSRDTALIERARNRPAPMIRSEVWSQQVRQVLEAFGLQECSRECQNGTFLGG